MNWQHVKPLFLPIFSSELCEDLEKSSRFSTVQTDGDLGFQGFVEQQLGSLKDGIQNGSL